MDGGLTTEMLIAEIRQVDEEIAANPLAGYSTRQLKAELARREQSRKQKRIIDKIMQLGISV